EQYLWDQAVVDAALDWIEQQDGPWFCWVHLMDPHAEHRPPPQLWDWEARPPREKQAQYHYYADFEEQRAIPPDDVRQRLLEMYSAEVRGSDEQFGRALGALRARPDWDSTAVLFSSDHGEELFETWFRYDHGMSMTEGVFRVPLIVRAPGVDPGVEPRIVEALQISPTVLGLFDVDAPYELAGPSLLASNPSLGYALSYGSDITTSIRGGKYRFWLRHRKRPFERDFSPWRHEARWFQNKRSLASYSDSNGVLPTWADPTEPDLVPTVKKLERALERRHKDVKQADGVRVNDPEYLKRLIELGYTDPTELGLSDEEFERLRAEVGQQD
ncbi:MAG: sulfatase-like hydrolase/transferase, partial [Planctomycetota bacterium]